MIYEQHGRLRDVSGPLFELDSEEVVQGDLDVACDIEALLRALTSLLDYLKLAVTQQKIQFDSTQFAVRDDQKVAAPARRYVYVLSVSQRTHVPTARRTMHLRFIDRSLPWTLASDDLTKKTYESVATLGDGMPLLLDERWRPVEPWLTYFRVVSGATSKSTVRNYGYDAFRFASFLARRGTDVVHAGADDITAYREWRLADAERPVSPATWQREVVMIRGVYSLLMQTGAIAREPWITVGRSSALRRPWHSDPDIRPLTRAQWAAFRNVGIQGRTASGEMDPSWRGRSALRSTAGAEIAVTTGMRVSEFSTLLDAELPLPSGLGASVLLEACAKYQKRRRVSVPASTLRAVDLYRQTERRAIVRRSATSLWARRDDMSAADITDPDGKYSHLSAVAHGHGFTVGGLGARSPHQAEGFTHFAISLPIANAQAYLRIITRVMNVVVERFIALTCDAAEHDGWRLTYATSHNRIVTAFDGLSKQS